jgi:hypothetical protein
VSQSGNAVFRDSPPVLRSLLHSAFTSGPRTYRGRRTRATWHSRPICEPLSARDVQLRPRLLSTLWIKLLKPPWRVQLHFRCEARASTFCSRCVDEPPHVMRLVTFDAAAPRLSLVTTPTPLAGDVPSQLHRFPAARHQVPASSRCSRLQDSSKSLHSRHCAATSSSARHALQFKCMRGGRKGPQSRPVNDEFPRLPMLRASRVGATRPTSLHLRDVESAKV